MFCSDVGAYQKLNLKTLQDIISIQLQCFRKEGKKKFIFCLRDFDEEHESLGELESTIRESMAEIWAQIKKPEVGMKSRDVYSIEVFPFRSFRINKKGFLEDCARLKAKLEGFRKLAANNLPLDGFVHFLRSSWEIIQSNKDLNIPDQKRIVANVRCKEEANMVFKDGVDKMAAIKNRVSRVPINNLVSSVKQILKTSYQEYEQNTTFYDEQAKKEHKEELENKFSDEVKNFIRASFDNKENKVKAEVEVMINTQQKRSDLGINSFNEFHQQKLKMYLQLDEHKNALNLNSKEAGEICQEKKAKVLQLLKVGLGNLYVKITDNLISDKMRVIKSAEDEFYEIFGREAFERILTETQSAYEELENGLVEVREEDPQLFSEMNEAFFENLRKKVFGRMREKLENMSLTTVVVRAFKKRFLKDKNNIPRKWKKIETESINTLYRQERSALLSQIKFLNEDLQLGGERIQFRTGYVELKDAVEGEIESIYNGAMDKHHAGNALQSIPKVEIMFSGFG